MFAVVLNIAGQHFGILFDSLGYAASMMGAKFYNDLMSPSGNEYYIHILTVVRVTSFCKAVLPDQTIVA